MRSQVSTSAGMSSASASSARRRSSASVGAPTIDLANPYAAPTSVSASQGMATPVTIHPLRGPSSLSAISLRLLGGLGSPVVGRVEPGALVARGERLQHALDRLPRRRAAEQAVRGDPLLDLEGRAVLAAVDVHGHGQPRFFYAGWARRLAPSPLHPWHVTCPEEARKAEHQSSTHHEFSEATLSRLLRALRARSSNHPDNPGL